MNEPAARFFLPVFSMSVPFYRPGAAGGRMPGLSILPASALMTFMPMIAALILGYRRHGDAYDPRLTFAILILPIGLGTGVWGRTMLTKPGLQINGLTKPDPHEGAPHA